LEQDEFVAVREALRDFYNAQVVLAMPDPPATYAQAMDLLKSRVESYLAAPSTDLASQIANVLGFLQDMGQAPHVTAAIRRHFHQPNARIAVSRGLLAALIERPVDEPTEVREVILGTSVRGYGRTQGRVRLSFVPNSQQATLALHLDAQARTQNVGVNGPATIYSTGVTDISARHTLRMNDLGLFAGDVTARACVNTNIYCIAARLRLVERIAWRRARQSLPQAEAVASGRATRRAESQFSDQVRTQLVQANRNFRKNFLAPLSRRQVLPELLRFSTTANRLLVTARRAGEAQLASPSAAPPDVGGDLSLRIHESAVGNFSETAAAGKTFTAQEFEDLTKDLPAGFAQESSEESQSDRDWSVTFRDRQPLSAEFQQGQATLRVHLSRFTSEGEELDYPINIGATYRVESAADGPKLVREGRVQVDWPVRRPGFGRRTVLESKFRVRFERMFRDELFVRDVNPPDAPRNFGALRDFALRSENGWFTVGMRRVAKTN
jgi:hypothetical protein